MTQSHQEGLKHKPTAFVDAFVEDFCGEGQDSKNESLEKPVKDPAPQH
jgi:hypothetical protein